MQSSQSGANSETAEAGLSDWGIDDSLGAELVEQSLGDLVCAWQILELV